MSTYYITTPIYYVNDRPTIGHCYTTVVADVAARLMRLLGDDVFFLTGTDEHAEKVSSSAAENGVTPIEWADRNAAQFAEAFRSLNCSHDDFIRTTEKRHTSKVIDYIRRLQETGDVYKGDYTGWYDAGQEEYVTETAARDQDYKSAITGKPLEKRTEQNYFFRLSAYEKRLEEHIKAHPESVQPEARRNEVLGRIRTGLLDVPISRAVGEDDVQWGIQMPDDPGHRIYVWIDALFNYYTAVDTEDRSRFWPCNVHLIGKDILWFHAVIWPCMLMALGVELPRTLHAHAWWIRDGQKMSKSLGNFIDLELIQAYCDRFSRDAFRWFLLTQGPLGANDCDFTHAKFVEVYNADLANGIGNAASRVGNMIVKYFDGSLPDPGGVTMLDDHDWPQIVAGHVERATEAARSFDLAAALREGIALVTRVDGYINLTQPFKLAKTVDEDPEARERLGAILYHCAEAIRIASLLLAPAIPEKAEALWTNWSCVPDSEESLTDLATWGGLKPGTTISKGEPLFMRADPDESL